MPILRNGKEVSGKELYRDIGKGYEKKLERQAKRAADRILFYWQFSNRGGAR